MNRTSTSENRKGMMFPRIVVLLGLALCTSAMAGQNVVVVLDDSGSMGERMRSRQTKIDAAKDALNVVLEQVPEDAQIGVVALNSTRQNDSWIIPLGPVNKQELRQAVAGIRASGGTPLGQFMKVGADALLQQRAKEHYGTYRLLIVTDGEANDQDLVERYLPEIMARGVTVDVIGIAMAERHSLATQVHSYRSADDPQSLTRAISEALAESSDQSDKAGESDFELLAAIPDEVAVAALGALQESGDQPIGTIVDSKTGEVIGPATSYGYAPQPNRVRTVFGIGLGFLCIASMFIIMVSVFVVLKAATRRR